MKRFIERFHSRGQHLCKFMRTKKIFLRNTNMAAVLAAVTSCENALFSLVNTVQKG